MKNENPWKSVEQAGMNPVGLKPLDESEMAYEYQKRLGHAKQLPASNTPSPSTMGAFPGQKQPIVDPRLS